MTEKRKSNISVSSAKSQGSNDSEEFDSSSDDEQYLEAGEPYGTFLAPSENPYDRRERVEELNKILEATRRGQRSLPTRVKIKEEFNQYFGESSGSESTQLRNSRQSSPEEKTFSSSGQQQFLLEKQRRSSQEPQSGGGTGGGEGGNNINQRERSGNSYGGVR